MNISVVTVCFNSEAGIARTIESFLAQDHPDREMLVIDGGSRDRTVEIARSYRSDMIRLVSEPDRGLYDAMNKGLRLFAGDAVGFLNSDDCFHDASVLGRVSDAMADADAVYGDVAMMSAADRGRVVRQWNSGTFRPGAFRWGWMPPHPAFYIRRELALAVGEFDLRYRIAADYDFMLRTMEIRKPRVRYVPYPFVDFVLGGVSNASAGGIARSSLESLASRRQHLGAPPVDLALFLKPLRKLPQFLKARRARKAE
ncbi:MAG TPA: glycosyltransferase family 2 protein [Rhizomicrobium sp.]|nr:glycosyltransferase family 2 protein [Rhizomicrobium sp.]